MCGQLVRLAGYVLVTGTDPESTPGNFSAPTTGSVCNPAGLRPGDCQDDPDCSYHFDRELKWAWPTNRPMIGSTMTEQAAPDKKIDADPQVIVERRSRSSDRRQLQDRRRGGERRQDVRLTPGGRMSGFKCWLHSFFRPRLGVDRRKNIDRRQSEDRRRQQPSALLTPEELSDLLS